jgi:hypothetical protein
VQFYGVDDPTVREAIEPFLERGEADAFAAELESDEPETSRRAH